MRQTSLDLRAKWAAFFVLSALLLVITEFAEAGYRNVDSHAMAAGHNLGNVEEQVEEKATRPALRATMSRRGVATEAVSVNGRFSELRVDALEEVSVTLVKPDAAEGSSVFAFTVHGGRINGKITDSIRVQSGGRIDFVVRVGKYFGNYPVVIRYAGREEVLNFWVNEARIGGPASEGAVQ